MKITLKTNNLIIGLFILISFQCSNNQTNQETSSDEGNVVSTDEGNSTKSSSNNLKTLGEIRGMIYGSTRSQLEDELGCIDFNFRGDNNNEDDNCPGKRLEVETGIDCIGYDFVVYKDFVLNSDKEVSDLLVVVKDWGKIKSKVTYVGIYTGKLNSYELCQE